jgi:chromosome segregation ATPase
VIATWNKLRALLRGPAEPPAPHAAATSTHATPAPVPASSGSPDEDLRQVRAQVARLETVFAEANARSVEMAGRVESLSEPTTRLLGEELKQEIQMLRRANEAVATRVTQLTEQVNALTARVDDEAAELTALEAKQRTLEERAGDGIARAKDAQAAVESAQATFRAVRQDMEARDTRRDREMNGRLAGLYIIGFISLTAALATLVIYLMQGRSH